MDCFFGKPLLVPTFLSIFAVRVIVDCIVDCVDCFGLLLPLVDFPVRTPHAALPLPIAATFPSTPFAMSSTVARTSASAWSLM